MMSMTHTNFDPTSHPRSADSGRFTETTHSAPEATLGGSSRSPQEAIDAITGGREVLEREVRSGLFDYSALVDARARIWEGAGGPQLPAWKLEGHINAVNTDITADNVERILTVTHHRAASGRYTVGPGGEINVTPVNESELRAADRQAEMRSDHVAAMWESHQQVGPEVEISESAARLFAEDALQNRASHLPIHLFPRLVEFADEPFTAAGGATHSKVDALHTELHKLREGKGDLPAHHGRRLDMLATFAMNALPGQS